MIKSNGDKNKINQARLAEVSISKRLKRLPRGRAASSGSILLVAFRPLATTRKNSL